MIGATATTPIRPTLVEATAASGVHPVVITAAVFWPISATAASIWAPSPTTTTTHRLIGKVNLDRQNIPCFDAVTIFILAQQCTRADCLHDKIMPSLLEVFVTSANFRRSLQEDGPQKSKPLRISRGTERHTHTPV